jgi:hypothetical protein
MTLDLYFERALPTSSLSASDSILISSKTVSVNTVSELFISTHLMNE